MSTMQGKVLIAALVLVALVVMFQVASAQYGYGGRGYGGYGGRGYGGYGGRGYGGYGGRGYGGYGGMYGGGRGYGGYGRGGYGRGGYGYRDTTGSYDYDTSSYPSYSSGGTYGDSSYGGSAYGGTYDQSSNDDDFSSYMDVYTTSSSSATPTTSITGQSDSSNGVERPNQSGSSSSGWSVDQFNGGRVGRAGVGGDPQTQWSGFAAQQGGNPQTSYSATNNLGSFDLVTGGDASGSPANGRATDRQRQRTVRAPGEQPSAVALAARHNRSSAGSGALGTPSVPSSTTTAAPEYVMINPTRGGSDASSDQDE